MKIHNILSEAANCTECNDTGKVRERDSKTGEAYMDVCTFCDAASRKAKAQKAGPK